jgi:cytosine permease
VGSLFITTTTIYGIRTLEKLANIAVPILFLFLIYVVCIAMGDDHVLERTTSTTHTMTLFEGISTLVGSSILVPVLMADFSRYIHNDKQSLLSVLGVAIGTPLVWIMAAVLADKTGKVDIIMIMNEFKLVLPAFTLIFVSTWVTSATNLYSVALTFSTQTETSRYRKLTIISGVLGTALAIAGFANYFIDFLNVLAIFSPAIASIYIIDFFIVRKQQYNLEEVDNWGWAALSSWAIASGLALMSYVDLFSITGAYFVDAFFIGGIVYYIWKRWFHKKLSH